uniref:Uncharacterized protein n=1 Tax=Nelumbo nucifera TaxID=4432 RepID=A0A822XN99_NELNU|nr:TPA_asm: hypothetical protein HUJ06_024557 [Nelumbo nucifera]
MMETLLRSVRKKKTLLVRSASPQKSTIKDVLPGVSKKTMGMPLLCSVRMKKRRGLQLAKWGDAAAFDSNEEEGGEQEDDGDAAGVLGSNEEEDYHWPLLCSVRMKKRRRLPLAASVSIVFGSNEEEKKMAVAVFGSNNEDYHWDIRGIMGSKVSLI